MVARLFLEFGGPFWISCETKTLSATTVLWNFVKEYSPDQKCTLKMATEFAFWTVRSY